MERVEIKSSAAEKLKRFIENLPRRGTNCLYAQLAVEGDPVKYRAVAKELQERGEGVEDE